MGTSLRRAGFFYFYFAEVCPPALT